ncbi:MAG: OsmC family protein [Proteobacteria bacterium]|nr:OsmC family protein [Pseudomonadota bacterium]
MSESLAATIASVQDKLRITPDSARVSFQSSSRLTHGFRSEVSIRQHGLVIDEPTALGGTDSGPNPIETLLAALGACQEITYRAYATALGIALDSVSVRLSGDIDLRGFFGVDDKVRAGFQNIRGEVHITSSASAAELARLKAAVDSHCPVLDMLSQPVPVTLELVRD